MLDEFIAEKSRDGWQIVSRTDNAVQMKRAKEWSRPGLIFGVLGLLVYGAGLILLILTVVDYLFQREKVGYITAADLERKNIPEAFTARAGSYIGPYIWFGVIVLAYAAFILFVTR